MHIINVRYVLITFLSSPKCLSFPRLVREGNIPMIGHKKPRDGVQPLPASALSGGGAFSPLPCEGAAPHHGEG